MKDLLKAMKLGVNGHKALYITSFVFQFFMTLLTVLTTYMTKVLVDTLTRDLDKAAYIESWVVYILSFGQGEEFLYSHPHAIAIALIIMAVITALVTSIRFYTRARAGGFIAKNLRLTLYSKLLKLPYEKFKSARSGDLIQTCTRDVDLVRQFMTMDLSNLTYSLFIVTLCTVILFSVSWKLTLVSIFLFPVMFVYSYFLIKEVRKRFRATDDAEGALIERITQNLNGIRVVKAYGAEGLEMASFEEYLGDYSKKFRKEKKLSAFYFGSTDIFVFASRSLAIAYALFLAFSFEITPGSVVLAYSFVNMMVWPLRNSASTLSKLGQTLASSDRVSKLLLEKEEDLYAGITPQIEGEIVFDHVDFAYPDDPEHNILTDVDISIKPGTCVAFMGKTGSGKSTLTQLLMRLYEPSRGKITIGGQNIAEIAPHHLRTYVTPVLQDPFLFTKSVKENIAITRKEASEEEIKKAATLASIDEAIEHFDEGYETAIGEKGVTLSGGQRQRMGIARALLSSSPILIFDDSLSALDAQTDHKIRSALKLLTPEHTILLVTHRISSAKDADKIVVLEKGRVVEEGTDESLTKLNGVYANIKKLQAEVNNG